MRFEQDTFESVHRRKRLAAWLAMLKGPKKVLRREDPLGGMGVFLGGGVPVLARK